MVHWNKTKIVATIGPASNKRKELKSLIHAGVDVFRLNGAHGTISEHVDTIRLIRAVAEREKFPAAILLDLPGPKIRVGTLKEEPIYLKAGTNITLRCGQQVQKGNEIPVQMKEVARGVHPGSQIFMNDGIIELKVLRVQGFDVECRVRSAGELRSNKGLNLPNAKLGLPSLMPKDEKLVQMAVKEKVDYLGLSFVRSAKNIVELKKILEKKKADIHVIAKIEKPEALDDIERIIRVSDAIMVARGDLGIEVPMNKVPVIQRDLLMMCHLAGKPAITATQMLESMVENRRPTRAEATDVANAVWEGTDAVMLSEETSIGKFPSNAVKAMALIASEAEKRMPILPSRQVEGKRALFQTIVMSQAAHLLADRLKAKAIVAPTRSGQTALYISKERPDAQILAPTTDEVIARRMSLYWGVRPMIMPKFDSVDELLKLAKTMALKSAYIKKGDTIVITSGAHGRRSETASLLEVRQVGV